jgi:hypothetical protein
MFVSVDVITGLKQLLPEYTSRIDNVEHTKDVKRENLTDLFMEKHLRVKNLFLIKT